MGRPAILLDRDGVINVNRPDHVKSWEEFRFLPGVLAALVSLSRLRLPMAIVSNQAVVNRGIISEAELEVIHLRMLDVIQRAGARIDSILYCPHDPSERCGCRKPQPGLLFEAARRFDADLTRSVFVGDACTDVQAGTQADCKTILVLTGRGRESIEAMRKGRSILPDAIAGDLLQAVPVINELLGFAAPSPVRLTVPVALESTPAAMD